MVQANSQLTMIEARPSDGESSGVALDRLLSDRGVAVGTVREEIVRSWRRSALSGLRPDQFDVPYEPDLAPPDRLERAARPVLDRLSQELATARVSVILTDAKARVVDRWVADSSLHAKLDGILLAPGFRYNEEAVGTNGIGTALEQHAPAVVDREEHFADALAGMACTAAPITDPRTGRVFGVVDLTSLGADANPLMLPVATSAAREIEQQLVEDSSIAERVLLEHFLQARRRTKGPLVSLNARTMITNPAASRILHPTDRTLLWEWVTVRSIASWSGMSAMRFASFLVVSRDPDQWIVAAADRMRSVTGSGFEIIATLVWRRRHSTASTLLAHHADALFTRWPWTRIDGPSARLRGGGRQEYRLNPRRQGSRVSGTARSPPTTSRRRPVGRRSRDCGSRR